MTTFTFVDMYCGAGLYSEGWRLAGGRPIFAIDADRGAVANYNRNVAEVAIPACVNDEIEPPEADVLLAGPPCQGFSSLGKRDPDDARNDLALLCVSWARKTGAKLAVVENVPPFLNSVHWRHMRDEFIRAGYSVSTWVLNAADHGTPQDRIRSFTIASRTGRVLTPPDPKPRIASATVFRTPIADNDPLHVWGKPTAMAAERIALVPPRGDKRDIFRRARHLCPPSWEEVGCQATDVWGRIDETKPSNTIRCSFQNPSKGRYLHPFEDRTISLREGARLQGVPDSWHFAGKRYPVARQIGNGVPIPLAHAVAKTLSASLR